VLFFCFVEDISSVSLFYDEEIRKGKFLSRDGFGCAVLEDIRVLS